MAYMLILDCKLLGNRDIFVGPKSCLEPRTSTYYIEVNEGKILESYVYKSVPLHAFFYQHSLYIYMDLLTAVSKARDRRSPPFLLSHCLYISGKLVIWMSPTEIMLKSYLCASAQVASPLGVCFLLSISHM